jgi:iron-sulfur cluster repair protein YtfE (RIC family)
MDSVDLDSSVPDWVIEHPELLSLFQELGIDYCCGGKSLGAACRGRGFSPHDVLARCESEVMDRPEKRLTYDELTDPNEQSAAEAS